MITLAVLAALAAFYLGGILNPTTNRRHFPIAAVITGFRRGSRRRRRRPTPASSWKFPAAERNWTAPKPSRDCYASLLRYRGG
jgi:hypothetical protein